MMLRVTVLTLYIYGPKTYGKSTIPKWNFHKILVNKKGKIVDTYASFTNPMSKKLLIKLRKFYNFIVRPSYAGNTSFGN